MSQYSCLDIIKYKAKCMKRAERELTHTQALEIIANKSSFSNYHELKTVAKHTPQDARLLVAAFGETDLSDAIFNCYDSVTDSPYSSFEMAVEDALSSEIASTNADGFVVEDFSIAETYYDETKGILTLDVTFLYQGEQSPDHVYAGSEFSVEAKIHLSWRNDKWLFSDEDFEVTQVQSDTDRDWIDEEEI